MTYLKQADGSYIYYDHKSRMYFYPENGFDVIRPYPPHLAHLYAPPTPAPPPPSPTPTDHMIHPYHVPIAGGYIYHPPYLPGPLVYPDPTAIVGEYQGTALANTKTKTKNAPDDSGWGDDPFDGKYAGSEKTALEKEKENKTEQPKQKTVKVTREILKFPNTYKLNVPEKRGYESIEAAIKWHMKHGLKVEDMEKVCVMECKYGGWEVVCAVEKPEEE